jgi:superfamily II RNA helicase
MPFRTVVILNDIHNDNLDTMLYHQMSGRAGRRGLIKRGI